MVALALALGGGPLSAAAVMAGAECAGLLVMAGFVHHHAPWLRYGRSGVAGAVLRRLAAPSIGFAGFTAGNALGIQGPVLVIGAALDPAAVAVFSTLRLLARAAELAVFALILQRALAFLGQRPGELVGAVLRPPVEVLGWLAGTASKRAVSPLRRRATAFPGKGPGRESGRCRVRRWGSPEDKPHAPTAVFRPSSPVIPAKAGRKRESREF